MFVHGFWYVCINGTHMYLCKFGIESTSSKKNHMQKKRNEQFEYRNGRERERERKWESKRSARKEKRKKMRPEVNRAQVWLHVKLWIKPLNIHLFHVDAPHRIVWYYNLYFASLSHFVLLPPRASCFVRIWLKNIARKSQKIFLFHPLSNSIFEE